MISGSLYEPALQSVIAEHKQKVAQLLAPYKVPNINTTDIASLMSLEKVLSANTAAISKVQIPQLSFDAKSVVMKHYDSAIAEANDKRDMIKSKAEAARQKRIAEHEQMKQDINSHNAGLIEPFKAKHNELLSYKDKLKYVFDHYDISPLDIDISDKLTRKEFAALIDNSLAVCDKYSQTTDNNIFNKIANPLKDEKNLQFTAAYMILLLVAAYFLMPILAIPIFYYMITSIHKLYRDIEALRIANALMAQIDYNRFVDNNDVRVAEELDISDIDAKLENYLKDVPDYAEDIQKSLKDLESDSAELAAVLSKTRDISMKELALRKQQMESALADVRKKINDFMSKYKQFPHSVNSSVVMERKMILRRVENRIDVAEMIPAKNIAFVSPDRNTAVGGMKLFLANMLCNVQVKQLVVDIIDPKNQAAEFTEFYDVSTSEFIRINSFPLNKVVEEVRTASQVNLLKLDGNTIDEFNQIAEDKGIVPMPYRLVIVLSDFYQMIKVQANKDDEPQQNEIFLEYLKYSAGTGITLWFLMEADKVPEGLLVVGDSLLKRADSIQYDRDLGRKCEAVYKEAFENAKIQAVDYRRQFANTAIPREKWWTFDTEKGIDMHFGLENGDPTKYYGIAMGDANVHALMGGATGAGKSAAINQTIISLITKYPPSELQIVFIDFKNVEAASLTAGYDRNDERWLLDEEENTFTRRHIHYARFGKIPHMKIISGTTDGEYALSVFSFLMQEMNRRQKIIDEAREKKIEDLRAALRKEYCRTKGVKVNWTEIRKDWDWYEPNVYQKFGDLPRLLVIFDEFQVMFNTEFVPQKIVDRISNQITAIAKLARAMGVHFWFTSQTMKGTMAPDTMDQFSMRAALRCSSEVSTNILGNPASGTITQKFGLIYTNDSGGQNPKANKLWKVPFLNTPELNQYIREVCDMLPEHNQVHNMAEFYDEKSLVPSEEFDSWYERYPDEFCREGVFVLGERADYSTNKAPLSTTLNRDSGEHFLIAAFERSDLMNLALTVINNIRRKGENAGLIINCQDKETYTLMEVDNLVNEAFLPLSKPDQDIGEFLDAIEGTVESRRNSTKVGKPVYIVLIQWERAQGIGAGQNARMSDRFQRIVREASIYGVHFIMVCKEKGELSPQLLKLFAHKISGLWVENSYMYFLDDPRVQKLPDAASNKGVFAFYQYGTTTSKFKIYQHTFTRQLQSREVVLN